MKIKNLKIKANYFLGLYPLPNIMLWNRANCLTFFENTTVGKTEEFFLVKGCWDTIKENDLESRWSSDIPNYSINIFQNPDIILVYSSCLNHHFDKLY